MSEREKQILEGVSKLPDPLKDRFLDKIEGAVMALDMTKPPNKEGGTANGPGEAGVS